MTTPDNVLSLVKEAVARTWRDARADSGATVRTFFTLGIGAAAAFIWRKLSGDSQAGGAALTSLADELGYAFGGSVAIGVLLFLWNLWLTPYRRQALRFKDVEAASVKLAQEARSCLAEVRSCVADVNDEISEFRRRLDNAEAEWANSRVGLVDAQHGLEARFNDLGTTYLKLQEVPEIRRQIEDLRSQLVLIDPKISDAAAISSTLQNLDLRLSALADRVKS